MVEYFKKHAGLAFLALLASLGTIGVWRGYLVDGYVYASKFGIKLDGDAAQIPLKALTTKG